MRDGRRIGRLVAVLACALVSASGCATMRNNAKSPDLRPGSDGYAVTADGWYLSMRHIRPAQPDPGKYPVVLCHGLGLNGTFWTITDDHLPAQLAARGYEVFVCDLRGSGNSFRKGRIGALNQYLRQTPFLEVGEGSWTMDDQSFYDVPAVLEFVRATTGSPKVNWVGHSLGGMLLYAYLEFSPERDRIANYVGMGATATQAKAPQKDMLRANRGLRLLLHAMSTGRFARPMMYARLPGLGRIDQFYFTVDNVDQRTISRFYGYALEDPGRGALKQLDRYLELGRLVSADGKIDYVSRFGAIKTPTLLVAGESDYISDIPSTLLTFNALGSPDKMLLRFGRRDGHRADYGHCDLVWSRYAPGEVFPAIGEWLDARQPGTALFSPSPTQGSPLPVTGSAQEAVDADLRPRLEPFPLRGQGRQRHEPGVGQP
jgi:lysosomal acid lipase/cholesteryl ester hydrolase